MSSLKDPVPITEQHWEEGIKPIVSICTITYNHEKYIREAIEGFLIQKTTFPVEIIIHDDSSTDNTADIILEYKEKYPNLFRTILQDENQWSKGGGSIYARFVFPEAKGKYIAMCEGDDYWTDPLKLQKQVEFMEANEDCSMCFHNAKVIYENSNKPAHKFKELEKREYSGEEILKEWTIPTASVLFKTKYYDEKIFTKEGFLFGDIVLFLTMAESGKILCLNDVMSVYRKHDEGATAEHSIERKLRFIEHHKTIQTTFKSVYEVENDIISKNYIGLSKMQLKRLNISFLKYLYEGYRLKPSHFFRNLFEVYLK